MILTPKRTSVIAPLAVVCLTVASCGIVEDEPAPPADTEPSPTEQSPSAEREDTASEEPEESETPESSQPALGQQGVSAGQEQAVSAGEQVFNAGGNAVDAAVAASFAVAVVEPVASGIGGGGSVIIAGPDGEPVFYDYREVVNAAGDIPASGTGIPGFVAGMGQLHEDYGELPWEEVIAPAIELAGDGFTVSEYLSERISTGAGPEYLADVETFNPGGEPVSASDTLVQPRLEETMQRLADAGWEDFYTGELAQSVAEQVEGVDRESLADYDVSVSEPAAGDFGNYQVISAPPALPGAALIQMLQIAESEGIADLSPNSAEYVDVLSRSWGVAEETVRNELGDPNSVEVPLDELTDPEANAEIDTGSADELPQAAPGDPQDSAHANTTHVSVVDEDGLTVSMTNTVTDFWGSGQEVDGYFVNNALKRFSDIESEANQPAPGRRSVTWSNPTLILDEQDQPVMAIGTPGGMQILPVLATVISQWALQERELQDALDTPRFRGEDSVLYFEQGAPGEQVAELEDLGWSVETWPASSFGSVQALVIDQESGTVTGADDPRRDGAHRILD